MLGLERKILIIHLGSRSDGLPLAYPDGAGGKELQRQRLVRHSLIDLLTSSGHTDVCAEDCGSCLASVDRMWTPESQRQKHHESREGANLSASSKGGSSAEGPEGSMRDSGIRGADKEATMHKRRADSQWPARFGQLDAIGATNLNAVTVANALDDVKLESAVRKQLLALEQELRLASPTRWAVDGAVVEKHLESQQVEISVAWGRPPPALHLPLTPFFTHNMLLIRVETEKCPKQYGVNSYSVPPNSILEHALYLLAHPVAGLAAIAAFHFGRHPEKSLLKRLRKTREHIDVTASGIAMHAAKFWGRATGASMQTFWIAQVRVRSPGHSRGSSIELLDGRLNAEAGSFVPFSTSQKSGEQYRFPADMEAWGWRYAEPLRPDEGPFLQGRLAGYGEAPTTCRPVDALVQTTAANLQTRIIPQMFVSGLRGRSVILALSSTEVPFKGEQLVSQADLEAEWRAETSLQRKQ
eukprot:XP_028355168.1 uncharacterized protein LOC114487705 [Physeter catodon]